jgi:hypothetical protein
MVFSDAEMGWSNHSQEKKGPQNEFFKAIFFWNQEQESFSTPDIGIVWVLQHPILTGI